MGGGLKQKPFDSPGDCRWMTSVAPATAQVRSTPTELIRGNELSTSRWLGEACHHAVETDRCTIVVFRSSAGRRLGRSAATHLHDPERAYTDRSVPGSRTNGGKVHFQ